MSSSGRKTSARKPQNMAAVSRFAASLLAGGMSARSARASSVSAASWMATRISSAGVLDLLALCMARSSASRTSAETMGRVSAFMGGNSRSGRSGERLPVTAIEAVLKFRPPNDAEGPPASCKLAVITGPKEMRPVLRCACHVQPRAGGGGRLVFKAGGEFQRKLGPLPNMLGMGGDSAADRIADVRNLCAQQQLHQFLRRSFGLPVSVAHGLVALVRAARPSMVMA